METLSSPQIADVLARLFAEAQVADGPLYAEWSQALQVDGEEMARLMAREAQDYRAVYRDFAGNFLNVSAEFGQFLYICARARRARHIVEFGTSFGVSTIHLAAALRDGGGGRMVSTELEPAKAERALTSLIEAGLADVVDIRVGDALETLQDGIDDGIDLVLLDGAWSLYLPVLRILESRLTPGALVIAENAVDESGDYLTYVRDPGADTARCRCRSNPAAATRCPSTSPEAVRPGRPARPAGEPVAHPSIPPPCDTGDSRLVLRGSTGDRDRPAAAERGLGERQCRENVAGGDEQAPPVHPAQVWFGLCGEIDDEEDRADEPEHERHQLDPQVDPQRGHRRTVSPGGRPGVNGTAVAYRRGSRRERLALEDAAVAPARRGAEEESSRHASNHAYRARRGDAGGGGRSGGGHRRRPRLHCDRLRRRHVRSYESGVAALRPQ